MKINGFHSEQPYCDCESCNQIRELRKEGFHVLKFKKITE